MNFVREKVSKKKKRFKEDGFDLDLTYITPRIIAMGFPSSDMEGLYRNPIGEVYKFYESRHKDRYKLYNLCAERNYDPERFHGRVSRYPFEDHNAPPIQLIVDCCKDIHKWLSEDENNVVGINCKAGKGRTGLIICCYLMHSGVVKNSEDAMLYYGTRRTKDGKGVTIASQRRYVKYYEQVLNKYGGEAPPPRLLKLTKLKITTVPNFSGKPFVTLEIKGREVCESKAIEVPKKAEEYEINVDYPVFDDVKVQLNSRKSKKKHQKMCHYWFSTAFVNESNSITLQKFEIDVANKDKKNVHFKENFQIEAFFEDIDEPKKSSKKPKPKSDKKAKENSVKLTDSTETKPTTTPEKTNKPKNDETTIKIEGEEFSTKRKRAQSFYDIEEEDEELSESEKDEREMERYFEEEEEEIEEGEESIKLKNAKAESDDKKSKEEPVEVSELHSHEIEETTKDEEQSPKDEEEAPKDEEEEAPKNEKEEAPKVEEEAPKDEGEEAPKDEGQSLKDEEEAPKVELKNGKKNKKDKSKKSKDKTPKQKKKSDKKASKKSLK